MKYKINQRVRYSEIDSDKKTDMAQIINYFQDCSTFQSEDVGLGLDLLSKKNRAWLLLSWQIIVDRYPSFGEEITIETWAYDWRSIYGYRNFDILDADGNRIAYANSIWVYTNTETLTPAKADAEDITAYGMEERIDMDYAPRKIRSPKEFVELEPFAIMKAHIDTNHHVNNAQYVSLAEEYLPAGFVTKQIRVEYKHSAVLSDMIYPRVTALERGYVVQLCDAEGTPYSIIEFQEESK